MSELKRCPFCGGEAKIDKTIANTVSVECTICHASSRMILCTEGDIEQKAIKAWNTRKSMDRIVEQIKSLSGYEIYKNTFDLIIEIVKEEGLK